MRKCWSICIQIVIYKAHWRSSRIIIIIDFLLLILGERWLNIVFTDIFRCYVWILEPFDRWAPLAHESTMRSWTHLVFLLVIYRISMRSLLCINIVTRVNSLVIRCLSNFVRGSNYRIGNTTKTGCFSTFDIYGSVCLRLRSIVFALIKKSWCCWWILWSLGYLWSHGVNHATIMAWPLNYWKSRISSTNLIILKKGVVLCLVNLGVIKLRFILKVLIIL